jgi:hypothetical protein
VTGALRIVGNVDAPTCVDGVCEVPSAATPTGDAAQATDDETGAAPDAG